MSLREFLRGSAVVLAGACGTRLDARSNARFRESAARA
jgi:hypothetical protein